MYVYNFKKFVRPLLNCMELDVELSPLQLIELLVFILPITGHRLVSVDWEW